MADDHYQTLDVEPNADIAQIKRRYRQLVRENHPDTLPISRREQAHSRMLAINLAWTTLSDPTTRAKYDLSQRKTPNFVIHPPNSTTNFPTTNFPTSSTRSATSTSTARTAQNATSAQSASTAPTSKSAKPNRRAGDARFGDARFGDARFGDARFRDARFRDARPNRSRLLTQVFEAAELYFFYGKAGEAIGLCRKVLGQDPQNAEAHALLGDIYADQGRFDVAVFMYERAVQSQPNNALYRQKWEALSGKKVDVAASGFAASGFASSSIPSKAANADFQAPFSYVDAHSPAGVTTTSSTRFRRVTMAEYGRFCVGCASALLALVFLLSGHLWPGAFGFEWRPAALVAARLLLASMLSALALGVALPLLDVVESFYQTRRRSSFEGAPTFVLVALAGIAFAPLGWAFALLLSLSTQRANRSLFRCIASAVLLAATLSFPARGVNTMPALSDTILWWSGRAIFPALLVGWALGSLWPSFSSKK